MFEHLIQKLRKPAPRAAAVPPIAPPPPVPYGLESIPADCTTLFLVRGEANQQLAQHCAQSCLGIETWHPPYASLAAFEQAEKIFVVLNATDDHQANKAFVWSLASDPWIQSRCVISLDGVGSVTKFRFLDLNHTWSSEEVRNASFERACHFTPLPTLRVRNAQGRFVTDAEAVRELDALCEPPPEPERISPIGGTLNGYSDITPNFTWKWVQQRGDENKEDTAYDSRAPGSYGPEYK